MHSVQIHKEMAIILIGKVIKDKNIGNVDIPCYKIK